MELWQYRADVRKVVDGDTLDLKIDLGFGINLTSDEARVRLRHVNTAEIYGSSSESEEYKAGKKQHEFVREWIEKGKQEANDQEWPFIIKTEQDDEAGKYGRWLAVIKRRKDGAILHKDLIQTFGASVEA